MTHPTSCYARRLVAAVSVAILAAATTGCVADQEPAVDDSTGADEVDGETGVAESELYYSSSLTWKTRSIPVCWINPQDPSATRWTREAVQESWEAFSPITFTGWNICVGYPKDTIRILVKDVGPTSRIGTDLGDHESMTLNFSFNNWSTACKNDREACVRGSAVHEFGHALGFFHEQARPDTPSSCAHEPPLSGGVQLGAWDKFSVMNYCNKNWDNGGLLSLGDKAGVRSVYGAWKTLPGLGVDVAVGGNAVYLLGASNVPGGHPVFRWTGSSWASMPGAGDYITVERNGTPWLVSRSHAIYRWDAAHGIWALRPGAANGIAAGSDGSIWILGTDKIPGGYSIHKWNGSGWSRMPGAGTQIAVGFLGTAWLVNENHNIYRFEAGAWKVKPGKAWRVAISQEGPFVEILGIGSGPGGHRPYMWDGVNWVPQPGGVTSLAIGATGMPWATNATNNVYYGY